MPPKKHPKKHVKPNLSQKVMTHRVLFWMAYLLIILHFLFLFVFPKISPALTFQRTWGFHFIAYFPKSVIILFYFIILLLSHPKIALKIVDWWENKIWPCLQNSQKIGEYTVYIFLSVISLFLFYGFRQKYGLLGDNFLRVHDIANGTVPQNELGTLHFYLIIYHNISPYFNLSPKETLVIVNCLTGPLYVFLSFCLAKTLGKNTFQKGMYFIGLTLIGIIQYFFGYIEIYNLITILIVLFLWTGYLAARDRISIIFPILFFTSAFFSHFMVSTFLPALFYLFYRKSLCRWRIFTNPKFIITEIVVALPIFIFVYIKIVRGNILIFTQNETYQYAMLSWTHLWEFINGQILAAPAAFLMLFPLLWIFIKHRKSLDLAGQFLTLAAFFTTLNSLVYNVQKGATDWDVLCMSGLPITILVFYLLFNALDITFIRLNLKYICLLFILFSASNTVTWILLNSTDLSIPRFIDMIENDPAEFYANNVHPPAMYLAITFNTNGLDKEAEYWYRQGTIKYPNDPRNFYNLATFLNSNKRTEEAAQILETLMDKFPSYPTQYGVALQLFSSLGKNQLIIKGLQNIVKIDDANPQILQRYYSPEQLLTFRAQLASVYINNKQWKEAYDQLTRVVTQGGQQITIDGKSVAELLKEVEKYLNNK